MWKSFGSLLESGSYSHPMGTIVKLLAAGCLLVMAAGYLLARIGYPFFGAVLIVVSTVFYMLVTLLTIWKLLNQKKLTPKVPKEPRD
jgi:hypothetical protein